MRDRWYADNRDLVKWGTLINLATENKIRAILQVAYYRTDLKSSDLERDGKSVGFPAVVRNHFRDIKLIHGLAEQTGIKISVLTEHFDNREKYHNTIIQSIAKTDTPRIVFLDPDTGLAPKRVKLEHVAIHEIEELWSTLARGDWLVLYQHSKRKQDWLQDAEERFQSACRDSQVFHRYLSPLASSVALLCACK